MHNILANIDDVLLMGPGPSCVPARVYRALSLKTLGHMDYQFIQIMDEIKSLLQALMGTRNRLTLAVSGTGSAGMETCFVNLIERGDRVLVLVNGVFGMRMSDVASRLGAQVDTLAFEWGTPVEPKRVMEKLSQNSYKIVAIVHAETSTGVKNPVEEIGVPVRDSGAFYLVDCVTSLGGIPVKADQWGADAMYSGTQKCLSCPPGLAPVTFSDRAVDCIMKRKTKVPNWYLDMSMILEYWEGKKRLYHHTAPINMLYGLYQALQLIFEEGVERVHRRHMEVHKQLVDGLEERNMKLLVEPAFRLPMLNAVKVPEGIDELDVRNRLRREHLIEIGGGLGHLAGKIWRIGLMGHTARSENVHRLFNALDHVLTR